MGLVYALVAYGFQLTYATSKSINFGQGELVMVSAFVSLTRSATGPAVPRWWCRSACSSARCSAWRWSGPACGWRSSRRARAGSSSPSSSASSSSPSPRTSGGATTAPSRRPSPPTPIHVLGRRRHPAGDLGAVGVLAVMGLDRALQAAHPARQGLRGGVGRPGRGRADGHLGHRAPSMLSYALSAAVAALAGILVSPITTVGPTMASALVLKAFSVAVVAGLESGFGVVVVGLFLGALESLAVLLRGQRLARGARARPPHPGPGRAPHRRLRQGRHPEGLGGARPC